MNWDAVAAAGELLGSVAVLVTLVYLAVQVNHAKEQMSRGTRNTRSEAMRKLIALSIESPRLRSVNIAMDDRLGVEAGAWTSFVLGGRYPGGCRTAEPA